MSVSTLTHCVWKRGQAAGGLVTQGCDVLMMCYFCDLPPWLCLPGNSLRTSATCSTGVGSVPLRVSLCLMQETKSKSENILCLTSTLPLNCSFRQWKGGTALMCFVVFPCFIYLLYIVCVLR